MDFEKGREESNPRRVDDKDASLKSLWNGLFLHCLLKGWPGGFPWKHKARSSTKPWQSFDEMLLKKLNGGTSFVGGSVLPQRKCAFYVHHTRQYKLLDACLVS